MNEIEKLRECVTWLTKADFYNPTPKLRGVSDAYRRGFLTGYELSEAAGFYFSACVPDSEYEVVSTEEFFRVCSAGSLMGQTTQSSHSEVLTGLGFRIVACSMCGDPLIFDIQSGKVYHFRSGYLYDDVLSKPGKGEEWFEVPATRDSVVEWSETSWESLNSFFASSIEPTKELYREGVLTDIAKGKVAKLNHYRTLGLKLDIVDEEGRTPLEVACQTGNKEVIALVEKIMRETG